MSQSWSHLPRRSKNSGGTFEGYAVMYIQYNTLRKAHANGSQALPSQHGISAAHNCVCPYSAHSAAARVRYNFCYCFILSTLVLRHRTSGQQARSSPSSAQPTLHSIP